MGVFAGRKERGQRNNVVVLFSKIKEKILNMLYLAKRKNKIMPFMGASGVKNHVKWN